MLMHNNTCWLSLGKVLNRFVKCFEICLFLQNDNKLVSIKSYLMWNNFLN